MQAQRPAPRSLKIGTMIQRETNPDKLASKECKHFRSIHMGQTVFMPSGAELQFTDGTFSSCDPEVIEALSNTADSRVGGIFYADEDLVSSIQANAKAQAEAIRAAAEAATKAAGEAPTA